MKTIITILAMTICLCQSAFAANTTGTTKATATLTSFCNVSATVLNFGQIPTSGYGNSTSTISVLCSKNVPYSIGLNIGVNGAGQRINYMVGGASGQKIQYATCKAPGFAGECQNNNYWWESNIGGNYQFRVSSTGTGANQDFTLYGYIFGGYYVPDSYTDTLTATVYY